MRKSLAVLAVLVVVACGKKDEATPAADTTNAASTPAADTAIPRDTASQM